MAHLGIDLGTSNTLVARVTPQGNPVVERIEGETMVPSAIYIEEEGGHAVIGKSALDMWAEPDHDPRHTFRRWKLQMGEATPLATLYPGGPKGKSFAVTPETLTTLMVENVLRHLSEGLGGEAIESVLVTVPHGWRRLQPERCRATREAAEHAEVNGQPVNVQPITVSEPVAAAAYWIWMYNREYSEELAGQHVLVCDVGGGTFDLSLIRIGGASQPLEVVDATNSTVAGDYADALLTAEICRQFNQAHHTDMPETAEEILDEIVSAHPRFTCLRRWLLDVQRMKHDMGLRLQRAEPGRKVFPIKRPFTDGAGNHCEAILSPETYFQVLEPLFVAGRDLLRDFMQSTPAPFAVVFCGGGSRIAGICDHIVAPVLREFMSPEKVEVVLERIPVNKGRVDEAIALGAALIANGLVSVQERLLCDIGLRLEVDSATPLPHLLDLVPGQTTFFLTPLLPKGTPLPARVSNQELSLISTLKSGEALDLVVLIEDNPHDPWFQSWELPFPEISERAAINWQIQVDAEGVLTVILEPANGGAQHAIGQVERKNSGRASIVVGPRAERHDMPRISPERLREAIQKLNSKTAEIISSGKEAA
jgi:molecular chaperone DnaK